MSKNPIIGIIGGTGKMGQWFTHFFEEKGFTVLIAGRKTKRTPKDVAKEADIVFVAVPIAQTVQTIQDILSHLKKTALLVDIASLKVMSLETMQESPSATLGLHPLFGPSVLHTQGMQIVFCRQKDNEYVSLLKKLFEEAGMQIIEMSADEHDYQMAYIQALTHATNLLFGKIVLDRKNELTAKLYTPSFTLQSLVAGRVLQQDLSMMGQIQLNNPYFLPILDEIVGDTKKLLGILQNQDEKEFIKMFSREQTDSKNFANYSTYQTNKILQMVNEAPVTLPNKISLSNMPKSGTVAFLGPTGTYSHLASQTLFPKASYKKIVGDTIFDLFMKVLNNEADFAIIPAENSTEGTVRETLDYLIDFSLFIVGSFELPIHHQLLSQEKKLADIRFVASHAQALAQCKNWLSKNLPNAQTISVASTTGALAEPKKGYAYIASDIAAKTYGLGTVAKNIEDNKNNATRFYVLAKKPIEAAGLHNKNTLLFLSVYNKVGILRDVLNIFAKYDLNLAKLESRPSREKVWDYHFFVEVEAKHNSKQLMQAIEELERDCCPVLRILGQT